MTQNQEALAETPNPPPSGDIGELETGLRNYAQWAREAQERGPHHPDSISIDDVDAELLALAATALPAEIERLKKEALDDEHEIMRQCRRADEAEARIAELEKERDEAREVLRSIAETRWDYSASEACLVMVQTDARAFLQSISTTGGDNG